MVVSHFTARAEVLAVSAPIELQSSQPLPSCVEIVAED